MASGQARLDALKAREKRFDRNEVIIREGTRADAFYLLIAGKVSVRVKGREVRTIEDGGSFFGEVAALCGTERTAEVVALERSKCYVFPIDRLAEIVASSPDLALRLVHSLARSVRETTEYVRSLDRGGAEAPASAPEVARERRPGATA